MIIDLTDDNLYLEHYGVKGMKWGQRKSMPLKDRSLRYQKRVRTQQSNINRLKRVATGKNTKVDYFVASMYQIPVAKIIFEGGVRNAAKDMLVDGQVTKAKIQAGQAKVTDVLARSIGVNYRYLDYKI